CIYIRQAEALGLGHAVLCAEPVIGSDPFAVLLADDLIDAGTPVMAQMTKIAAREQHSVIGVMQVPSADTSSYRSVDAGASDRRACAETQRSGRRFRELPQSAPMTLTELRYIVAVAQERNFGRAAQRCFISQPALSIAIQKLEEELGIQLFERAKSEVTVTPV